MPTNVTFDVWTDNGKIDILGKFHKNTIIGNGENEVKLITSNGKITVGKIN
ncbi:hypothetical protein [Paracerasibacillus soli]|uniref:Adhesin domain-containing protein n=2 Tax=Paracerasibacillus soli TaxID=480284 RepID=A0ABU5CMA1_9BACI|nr:hypothetical protein [Virgibacillus soli]MDY0407488.1 hypothetical protein [Virgibacillus soli]